jgi:hypothetical protein
MKTCFPKMPSFTLRLLVIRFSQRAGLTHTREVNQERNPGSLILHEAAVSF